MAKRKGATKSKTSTKKAVAAIQSDNSQTVKDTHQLKDDPGGGVRVGIGNDIKNRMRSVGPKKSSNHSIEIVPIMQTVSSSTSPSSSSSASAAPKSTKSADAVAAIDAYHVQNSSNLFNNNQIGSTSSCSSSDLKYLHKKFKRLASTIADADAPVSVGTPSPPQSAVHFNGYATTKNGEAWHGAAENGIVAMVQEAESLVQQQRHSCDRLQSSAVPHRAVSAASPSIPFANHSDINATCDLSRSKLSANSSASGGRVSPSPSPSPSLSKEDAGAQTVVVAAASGHVCPFCQLVCAKPSVLRKHIRAHTNERPYPCVPCGFAFKTKSNLHKHYRSRAHAMREKIAGGATSDSQFDLDMLSDHDMSSCSTTTSSDVISRPTSPTPSDECASPAVGLTQAGHGSLVSGQAQSQVPPSTGASQHVDRPYKPKFHKAALYHHCGGSNGAIVEPSPALATKEPRHLVADTPAANASNATRPATTTTIASSHLSHPPMSTHKLEFLKEHISKIISQNEAIMEGVEPALQKKYHKITGISRGNSFSGSSAGDATPAISSTTPAAISSSSSPSPSAHGFAASQTTKSQQRIDDPPKSAGKSDARVLEASRKMSTHQQPSDLVLQMTTTKSPSPSTSAMHAQQPLNLTTEPSPSHERPRKRSQSIIQTSPVAATTTPSVPIMQPLQIETASPSSSSTHENQHPQNPERSIIKSLLLNSRGLAVPTTGEGEDAVYTCPLCKISFRSADILQYHTKCHCQGTPSSSAASLQHPSNVSPHSAPISPVGSPSHKYFRSNSFNLCLPEKYSPNTLKKLASSSLRHPLSLAKLAAQQTAAGFLSKASMAQPVVASSMATSRSRPENIVINTSTCPAPTPLSSAAPHPASLSVSSQCVQITKQLIDASLPSPGPLLGKTRLVDAYNNEAAIRKPDETPFAATKSDGALPATPATDGQPNKRQRTGSYTSSHRFSPGPAASSEANASPINSKLLQMCGGDIKIVARKEETVPRFGSSGGSIISISPSPDSSMPEPSPLSIRAGLLSGGSIIEVPKKPSSSASPSTASSCSPDSIITPKSSLQTTNKHMMGNYFQFPPINSITGYNPLTLPPTLPPAHAQFIYHGGKLIPFVPGMPGPDSLTAAAVTPAMPAFTAPISPQQTRSPSPNRKKIIPSSPVAIRAMAQPAPSLLSPAKPSAAARRSPKMKTVPLARDADDKLQPKSAFTEFSNGSGAYPSAFQPQPPHQALPPQRIWSPALLPPPPPQTLLPVPAPVECSKRSFNFTRIADNLSPTKSHGKSADTSPPPTAPPSQPSPVIFESALPRSDVISKYKKPKLPNDCISPLHIDVTTSSSAFPSATSSSSASIPTLILPTSSDVDPSAPPKATTPVAEKKSTKFLRPSSLPLKPGTFTPKRHHGITPTANTLPLISPETPRPSKHCVQMYLNGHAYTYLGLKCSTKPFYCTVNRPQPVHFTNQHKLSIYSNWQTCAESNPHPLGLSPKEAMSLYDSRQRQQQHRRNGKYTVADSTTKFTTLHSQSLICTSATTEQRHASSAGAGDLSPPQQSAPRPYTSPASPSQLASQGPEPGVGRDDAKAHPNASLKADAPNESGNNSNSSTSISPGLAAYIVPGGYESNEDYTYVRGRGRGRYVCSECGIRCKKPSMLKKHIRTHTDVRPYTCQHCEFSFKTKGNLTKHMKSKAHYKKCVELGLNPLLSAIDEDYNGDDDPEDSSVTSSCGERTSNMVDGYDESDSDEMSDGDDAGNESSDTEDVKFRLPEHEAAHCLLSLSRTPPNCQNSLPSPNMLIPGQPISHPYVGTLESTTGDGGLLTVTRQPSDFAQPRAFEEFAGGRPLAYHSSGDSEAGAMQPIDLTKPRVNAPVDERKPKFKIAAPAAQPPAPTYAGPAGLLNSLMSITDKVPAAMPSLMTPNAGVDYSPSDLAASAASAASNHNDIHMQTYLTERALQKSKMKLSQMTSYEKSIESVISGRDRKVLVVNNSSTFAKQPVYYGKPTEMFDQLQKSSIAASGAAGSAGATPKMVEQRNQRRSLDDSDATNASKSHAKPPRKISMPPINVLDLHAPKQMMLKTEVAVLKSPKIISKPLHSAMNAAVDGKIPTAICSLPSSIAKPIETEVPKPFVVVTTAFESGTRLTLTQSSETVFRIELSPPLENPPPVGERSGMDTLADIAAAAVPAAIVAPKASPKSAVTAESTAAPSLAPTEITPPVRPGPVEPTSHRSTDAPIGNDAKTIASAYLKMSSAEYFKAHGEPMPAEELQTSAEKPSMPIITDDSCGSSDPDVASDVPAKKFARSNAMTERPLAPPLPSAAATAAANAALSSVRTVVVGEDGFKPKSSKSSDLPVVARGSSVIPTVDGGRSVCTICNQWFLKESQMKLHLNIHFMNPRRFRCESCAITFRTAGHLQKHERSEGHRTKVRITTTFGQVSARNPRPFECSDCRTAFRIQGHLAKHIRSKTHVQKLECLQKLPFGTFTEIERAGIAQDIDTTDCDRALASLKVLAHKLGIGKDANGAPLPISSRERTESNSEDGEAVGVAGGSSTQSTCSGDDTHNDSLELNGDTDASRPSKRRKLNDEREDSGSE